MKLFVLISSFVLLAAVDAHAACTTVNGQPNISANVYSLPAGYNPVPSSPNGRSPLPACTQKDAQDAAAIQQAFSLAPPGLQKDLCNLKCIFVMTGNMHSWGKWDNPDFGGTGEAAIAINKSDLNKPVSVKMNEHLRGISTGRYSVTPANLDSGSISLMYTLAHEMAHTKWRPIVKSGNISANCPVDSFIDKSWSSPGDAKVWRWAGFTNETGGRKHNIPAPSQVLAGRAGLQVIYQNGVATALGANNAEEDFVETYALATLMPQFTPQIDIKITITGGPSIQPITVLVNNDRGDAELQFKFGCVNPLLSQ